MTEEQIGEVGSTTAAAKSGERAAAATEAVTQTPQFSPENPGIAAFFDIDNTVIRGASSFHLARALYQNGFFRMRDLIYMSFQQGRYLLFGENNKQIDEVRSQGLELMRGHSVAEVIAIGEQIYEEVLGLRIFPGTKKLIEEHLARGHQVWFVSATPLEVASLIARRLGVTGALGTVAEHQDGMYTGKLVGDLLHGQAKATAIKKLAQEQHLDLCQSYAYGDSSNDLHMLRMVGKPCAINPDRRLRRVAQQTGWPQRDFRAKRRNARRGAGAASLVGAGWALTVGVRKIARALRGPR